MLENERKLSMPLATAYRCTSDNNKCPLSTQLLPLALS